MTTSSPSPSARRARTPRLAARLTGWRIDIKSETQLEEEEAGYGGQEWAEGEWVEDESGEMVWKPAEGGEAVSAEAVDARGRETPTTRRATVAVARGCGRGGAVARRCREPTAPVADGR